MLFAWHESFAQQGIKGKVTDGKNEPVGFVTIYCLDQKKGTNSNSDGTYELSLPPGEHRVHFQCVGYQTQVITVSVSSGYAPHNVLLQDQTYSLKEVNVASNRVDPAVWIMRKAIAAAPYYRRQVLNYNAKVYIKGSGKLDEIPFLFKKMLKEEGITEGFTFLVESINELTFTQPNTYKEKALSVKNSFGEIDGAPEPMSMLRGSMYSANTGDGVISPLSPQAFSVYTFKLEGSYFENGREVNRIKVIPRRKGKDVWQGYMYIIEGLWCLHSTDLTNYGQFEQHTITSFRPVAGYDYVWMPVTYDINVKGGFLGFKGAFRYLASVGNYKIMLNPNLDHKWVMQKTKEQQVIPLTPEEAKKAGTESVEKPKSKRQQDIEKLLDKEQLSKMEMLKLANKMRKESEEANRDKTKDKLQVIDEDSSEIIVDSMAGKRDSAYWLENRPVPLMQSEVVTYIKGDSIADQRRADTTAKAAKDTSHKHGFDVAGIFLGAGKNFNKGKHYVRWSGFVGQGSEIFVNTVDGWGTAVQWQLGNRRKDAKEWKFTNKIRVPFERQAVNSYGRFEYDYRPLHFGKITFEGGSYVSDYNTVGGPGYFVNNVMLIIDQRNLIKLYQQEYGRVIHTTELSNGLTWQLDANWYNRYELWNISRYAKKEGADSKITPNEPIAGYTMPTHQATLIHTSFTYTPFQRYKIEKGRKVYVQGKLPTFKLNYTAALPNLLGSDVDYHKMDLSVTERIKPMHWLYINTRLSYGFFLDNTHSYFPDYNHLNGNRAPLITGDPLYTFRQLDYYAYSTTNSYLTLHGEFDFKRLIVKRLPIINMTGIREVVFYNGLLIENLPTYQELGYGLEILSGLVRGDVFVGLKDNSYNNWGMRLILNLKVLNGD
jgi:hypothetical protein